MAATRKPSCPAVPKNPSPAAAIDPETVQALKHSSCPTLSGKSTLHYELGLDAKQTPLIRITACNGGGFFSKEWVSLSAIRSALQKSQAVTAILLFPLFKGKSVNTPGYLLAVLRAEKLIQPLAGKTRVHELCADWDARVASIVQGGSGKASTGKSPASQSKPASKAKPASTSEPGGLQSGAVVVGNGDAPFGSADLGVLRHRSEGRRCDGEGAELQVQEGEACASQ